MNANYFSTSDFYGASTSTRGAQAALDVLLTAMTPLINGIARRHAVESGVLFEWLLRRVAAGVIDGRPTLLRRRYTRQGLVRDIIDLYAMFKDAEHPANALVAYLYEAIESVAQRESKTHSDRRRRIFEAARSIQPNCAPPVAEEDFVAKVLARLTDTEQMVLRWWLCEELTERQIALATGLTKDVIQGIKARLRSRLDAFGDSLEAEERP